LDVFADQTPQHPLHVLDGAVHVQYPGLQDLLAAEGEELLGQGRRPLGRLQDVVDILAQARIVEPDPEELPVSGDDSQKVVEIVGNATRQTAHGLHLLGLEKLCLEAAPFGDVHGEHKPGLPSQES
jgi:hypothetical protein